MSRVVRSHDEDPALIVQDALVMDVPIHDIKAAFSASLAAIEMNEAFAYSSMKKDPRSVTREELAALAQRFSVMSKTFGEKFAGQMGAIRAKLPPARPQARHSAKEPISKVFISFPSHSEFRRNTSPEE